MEEYSQILGTIQFNNPFFAKYKYPFTISVSLTIILAVFLFFSGRVVYLLVFQSVIQQSTVVSIFFFIFFLYPFIFNIMNLLSYQIISVDETYFSVEYVLPFRKKIKIAITDCVSYYSYLKVAHIIMYRLPRMATYEKGFFLKFQDQKTIQIKSLVTLKSSQPFPNSSRGINKINEVRIFFKKFKIIC